MSYMQFIEIIDVGVKCLIHETLINLISMFKGCYLFVEGYQFTLLVLIVFVS